MKHETEPEIDTLVRKLRRNAMEDLIATALGTPRPEFPSPIFTNHAKASHASRGTPAEAPDEDGLTRFVKAFLRAKRIKLTKDEFRRVLNYFRKEMNTPSDGRPEIRQINWRNALKYN